LAVSPAVQPLAIARRREDNQLGVKTRRSRAGTCRRTDEEEDDAMHTMQIQDYARQLLEAHGDKAAAEAAQKAVACEKAGNAEQARTWRQIEAALMLMRGPRQG
jgi:hypothetical protein